MVCFSLFDAIMNCAIRIWRWIWISFKVQTLTDCCIRLLSQRSRIVAQTAYDQRHFPLKHIHPNGLFTLCLSNVKLAPLMHRIKNLLAILCWATKVNLFSFIELQKTFGVNLPYSCIITAHWKQSVNRIYIYYTIVCIEIKRLYSSGLVMLNLAFRISLQDVNLFCSSYSLRSPRYLFA